MRITPRKEELQLIKDILEDPTFESADQMAKALFKEVCEAVWMRDWYVMVHVWNNGAQGLNFGPFASEAEIKTVAGKLAVGGTAKAVKIYSPGVLLAGTEGKNWKGFCMEPRCGHAPWMHSFAGSSRGQCRMTGCECPKWEAEAKKKGK